MDKKKIYYSSRFWICLYACVVAFAIAIQIALKLGNYQLGNIQLNPEANIPLDVLSWYWFAIVSLFCGFDRAVDIRETLQLSSGQMSMGELGKLRSICIISLAFVIVSILGTVFVADVDFQTEQFASTFAMTVLLYTAGNKAVKFSKYYSLADEDKDGIPDEYQDEYYKWERTQRKEGVDPQFITFDYFMDEREE